MLIQPKNWGSFQHYKDRDPPWIKLHKGLLDNYEYQALSIASKALAPMLWLLASEHKDGVIDAENRKLCFRLRMKPAELEDALRPLIAAGFFELLHDASGPIAQHTQDATPEAEAQVQAETQGETEAEPPAIAVATSKPLPVRATRWPSDQEVPAEWLRVVSKKFVQLGRDPPDLRLEATKFVNYWASKSGKDATKLDWEKTFENWCLNARSTDQRSFADRKLAALKAGARGAAFVDERPGQGVEDPHSNLVRLAISSKP